MSRRLLEIKYKDFIGISPKMIARTLRIVKSLGMYEYKCSEIAGMLGFADQAHFIRDFKALIGVTPAYFWDICNKKTENIALIQYLRKSY